ncbi:MAG: hypothetical protein ABSG89_04155 [Bacteroidales bacterium]|jgi:hypothetical protein
MFRDCLFHKTTRKKIKKSDQELVYKYLEERLVTLDEDIKSKFECSRSFLKELCGVDDLKNASISLGWVDQETLIFLFTSLLLDYETTFQNSKKYLKSENLKDIHPDTMKSMEEKMGELKVMEKNVCYWEVEVEDIFPVNEFTTEEVKFIDNILDKIHVDPELVQEIMLSTGQLIHLLTGIIREYDTFKSNPTKGQSMD